MKKNEMILFIVRIVTSFISLNIGKAEVVEN
jgi:hypothetical protein